MSQKCAHQIAVFLIYILCNFLYPRIVLAEGVFGSAISTLYTIDNAGVTTVKHTITLTNLTPTVFISEYSLTVGSQRLKNLKITDQTSKTVPHTVETTPPNSLIHINFSDQVVGKGKNRIFNIEYSDVDIAAKVGNVLEISIPKLVSSQQADEYRVTILVPVEFGNPISLSPNADENVIDPVYRKLVFNTPLVKDMGIHAIFGDKQIYNFTLTFNLHNPTITPVETQIALPPDTSYQEVYYHDINPIPKHISVDPDGNWIATYALESKEAITITAKGSVVIYPKPTQILPVIPLNRELYTSETKYWEANHPDVKKQAAALIDARSIYDFLVTSFRYDVNRLNRQPIERYGAAKALNEPQSALCQEFTDTFIALARSKGIPARLLTGYAYTQNNQIKPLSLVKDVLHAWVEYYDDSQNTWIAIDPTWANTTSGSDYFSHLDFNHITFAIQGISSSTPFPAGYYANDTIPAKTVDVEIASLMPLPKISLADATSQASHSILLNSINGTLSFFNLSNRAIYQPNLSLTIGSHTQTLSPTNILPFNHVTMPINFTGIGKRSSYESIFTLNTTSIPIKIKPNLFSWTDIGIGLTLIVAVALTITAFRTRRVLVHQHQK